MIRDPEKPIRTRPLPDEYPGVHSMDEDEVEAAVRVVRSKSLYRYYGVNPQHEVAAFEAEFARFIGVRHAVAVTSGTSALHTALCALQVGPGDEVIIPAYMWVSVVAAVVNLGAIPVLAEIDETFGLDPADVERKITSRTAGIIAVHMNGCAVNIPRLAAISRRHSVFLLEDCAQCVGATVAGRRAGTFGDVAIFSFQLNKNMTVGEAGAVVTNDELLYRRVVAIQDSGYSRSDTDELQMDDAASYSWGRGVRMDELRAAVLRVQLRKVETTIERMRHSKNRILESLYPREQITFRRRIDPAGDTSCFLLTIFPHRDTAREINRLMRLHGITTKSPDTSNILLANYGMHIYYNIPSLVQKVGTGKHGFPWTLAENQHSVYSYERGACPASDDLFERTQLLVIPSCLTAQDEEDIIESFHRAMDAVLGPVTSMTSRLDQREYLTSPCG
ncbi:MAG: DegT/DnrJ/EryC1/StrS family aminotransferase [Acidobacteriaceae bacterium]|nr:DegT/DnrJ/EryC1/StrS family aminotransferase [Acidobacteriaceae bacterium]